MKLKQFLEANNEANSLFKELRQLALENNLNNFLFTIQNTTGIHNLLSNYQKERLLEDLRNTLGRLAMNPDEKTKKLNAKVINKVKGILYK